ncbi:hypothetical protein diail_1254, partial [Diaporthe ilicicola]
MNSRSSEELHDVEPMIKAADIYQRLDSLLGKLEARFKPDNKDGNVEEDGDPSGTAAEDPSQENMISSVKECDWEHFINRFSPDEPLHAIEILIAGPQLENSMASEAAKRQKGAGKFESPKPQTSSQIRRVGFNSGSIHRVRIQSKRLLEFFGEVTGHTWESKPHTFVRPFQYLVQNHDKFKQSVQHLESQRDRVSVNQNGESLDPKLLDDLRCYIEFVEERLLPQYTALREKPTGTSKGTKIHFDDIGCLFKPGDLVFVPRKALSKSVQEDIDDFALEGRIKESPQEISTHQKIWRFYSGKTSRKHEVNEDDKDEFIAKCYYLEYDGATYGAVGRSFNVSRFAGDKDVNELDIYPLRFCDDWRKTLDHHIEQRRLVVDNISRWHMAFEGWSLTTDPLGIPVIDMKKSWGSHLRQTRPEYIQGQVIVDFREACYSDPQFAKFFLDLEPKANSRKASRTMQYYSPHEIMTWSDFKRQKILRQSQDILVVSNRGYPMAEYDEFLKKDPYVRETTRPQQAPESDDIALMPLRVFVYSLRKRKFVPVDGRQLTRIPLETGAFDQLQLPIEHKHIIQAAVQSHLRRQLIERKIEKKGDAQLRTQDFIPGKGRGLLIMMHGEPGVGKTATAEAVAQVTRRPLFPISCSDLPINWNFEDMLDEIFRLAHLWDCVLLMDEADVILSTRSTYMGSSNAHVSIFLKKLEYYKGILMLTTNRIGKLDPAMSSRIHIILHYKRLGPTEIERIFRTNIKMLQESEQQQYEAGSGERPLFIVEADVMKFAVEHCTKHPKGKGAWNGRQIRNAFLVAAALARQEAEQPGLDASSGFQPQLRSSHFQEVEKLIEEYHSFRAHVLGGDDSRRARLNEERDDDYEGETSYMYSGGDDGRGAGIVNRIRHFQAHLHPDQHMDANRNMSFAG